MIKKKEIQSMGESSVAEEAKCPVVGDGGGISELTQGPVVGREPEGRDLSGKHQRTKFWITTVILGRTVNLR